MKLYKFGKVVAGEISYLGIIDKNLFNIDCVHWGEILYVGS